MVGRHFMEFLDESSIPFAIQAFQDTIQEGLPTNGIELLMKRLDGSRFYGELTGSIYESKSAQGTLVVIRDITTEKAAERALVEMGRMKSEFISTAAHELNTPLSTMMAYAEILRDPEDFGAFTEAQKKDFVVEIYESGEALSRIIADLLDISRIESGRPVPLVLQETNLIEVLEKKISSFLARCPGRDLQLSLPDSPDHTIVKIDRHRINQAIENLLSNAEKYSDNENKIVLIADEKDDHWEIRVEDEGVGMSPDQLSRVFDKFYRVDASNTAISGLGLGMSIVKHIVDTHSGEISIDSAPGNGTSVKVRLPIKRG
jgi:two-component system phosphate regulon sensor histidine kinase PhoR